MKPTSIQVFVAKNGDHHLIDPRLQSGDERRDSYQELVTYLTLSTGFIETVAAGKLYQPVDCYDQYKRVMDSRMNERDISEDVLQRVHAFRHTHQNKKPVKKESLMPTESSGASAGLALTLSKSSVALGPSVISMTPAAAPSEERSETVSLSLSNESDETASKPSSKDSEITADATESLTPSLTPELIKKSHYGPTVALLKLQLGEEFTGDIRTDFETYLKKHFAPINWSDKQKLTNAGRNILTDC